MGKWDSKAVKVYAVSVSLLKLGENFRTAELATPLFARLFFAHLRGLLDFMSVLFPAGPEPRGRRFAS